MLRDYALYYLFILLYFSFYLSLYTYFYIYIYNRSFHPGSYFGKGGEFNKAQAAQRKEKILGYMQQNDIYGEIRQKLYRALRKDLRDVEIDLEK
jgi:hypothetical protein